MQSIQIRESSQDPTRGPTRESNEMPAKVPHIAVCVCTYTRAKYLKHLLAQLAEQDTGGLFTYSVIVVDNDQSRSAEPIVSAFTETSPLRVTYLVEERQNIALARNMAINNVRGEFVAFIDDDEFPPPQWLRTLFTECEARGVAGVLGPVKPRYEGQPPKWVVEGHFYDRSSYPTGLVIDGMKGRTGNVLFRKLIVEDEREPFRPEFRTGEDQDFFGRMILKGHVFTWCHEALVHEWIPAKRWNRKFLLRRALLRGSASALGAKAGARDVVKSLVAIFAYLSLLPITFIVNKTIFMSHLVSLFDHLGKVLAIMSIHPVKEQYITE